MAARSGRNMTGITASWLARHPLPDPDASGNKNTRGVVLVVGGAVEVPGAVFLSGIGALRAGAGKLQLATCRDVIPQIGMAVPEALVVTLPQTAGGAIAATAADDIVRRARDVDALLLGPGMMDDRAVHAITSRVMRDVTSPVLVIDAAALTPAAHHPQLTLLHHGRLILTPHAGEMAKMMDVDRQVVDNNPREMAEHAAATLGAVIVLKGPVTYVTAPGHRTCCYTDGSIGLATSGSGDTLAGVIAGLTARGTDPMLAACWGVFLHGSAGNVLTRKMGRVGFLARELLDEIPLVMQKAARRKR